MKTDNYILIYDDKCPMCAAYTSAFVKCGILPQNGRKSFTSADESLLSKVDVYRGKNEIPLIDAEANKVYYGIDSLLELLGTKMQLIKTIGRLQLVYWFLKKLYKFISYNRKVIVAKKCSSGQFDCSPEFNYTWRLIFLVFFLCFNTLALFPVQHYVFANSIFNAAGIGYLQLLHAALVSINIGLAFTLSKNRAFEYIGQVNMLATITVFLLLILAGANKVFEINTGVNNAAIVLIAALVFKEYVRRMRYAGTLRTFYITGINAVSITGMLFFLWYNLG